MSLTFRLRVQWPRNELLLPAELYNIKVPTGLSSFHVRAPRFVDVVEMGQLAKGNPGRNAGGGLAIVEGMVTRDLRVSFADPSAQWRRLPAASAQASRNGPGQFKFTGGDVFVDLTLGLYILKMDDPAPDDDLAVQIFAEVYGHELLHVLDELDVASNWLLPRLNQDPDVIAYLVQQQIFTYGTPQQTIEQAEQEFRDYIKKRIEDAARVLWTPETNARAGRRDSPAQYKAVGDRINSLRAQQINRPH